MEFALALWKMPLESWKLLLVHPFWLAAVILVAWQVGWKSLREHMRFGKHLHPPTPLLLRILAEGAVAGLLLSWGFSFISLPFRLVDVAWLWVVTLCLACFRLRFACLSYAVGLISLLSLVIRELPAGTLSGTGELLAGLLREYPVLNWLWLVALLHMVEWLLVRIDGEAGSTPVVAKDVNGQRVGGYLWCKIWPIPMVVQTAAGWLPLPVLTGYSRLNLSRQPLQQKRRSSSFVFFYALTLAVLTGVSMVWKPGVWLAAGYCLAGHEAIHVIGRFRERHRTPLYAKVEQGLKVWAVLPHTPAEEMGWKPGETVLRVNGAEVSTLEELRESLDKSPAFCKMEGLDVHGEAKLAQRSMYEGDPPHLGIVAAPEPGPVKRWCRTSKEEKAEEAV
ncbi:hypothetical protein GCM10011571_02020 [Marinithermofilum abyssi]|uniref:PDZ domain-containing protein n=1 Tax=Marinithermofilum abyssi TaxID=1571185 RepID=A0A8J2VE11_9BACL|nr:hypothetical protein [Marinithermofilum abyssi]GGE04592.1 hypothetical protein GCM10011571_02020 [Marinithermofilum abyssi]